ncbi:hypothetical protein DQ04_18261000 [Trypanosoma grayi]|uniref:hypothetical protein n=1 Tax=Trypanosoma grayi TaxID=71804 RepID=UPI0004F4891D|nr:hypothetical protein DQ04_18261000 [Trypanosoma grayi]KEG05806.1 hypothetical protein DQ04_18261000 [Trypanosoma grayi]
MRTAFLHNMHYRRVADTDIECDGQIPLESEQGQPGGPRFSLCHNMGRFFPRTPCGHTSPPPLKNSAPHPYKEASDTKVPEVGLSLECFTGLFRNNVSNHSCPTLRAKGGKAAGSWAPNDPMLSRGSLRRAIFKKETMQKKRTHLSPAAYIIRDVRLSNSSTEISWRGVTPLNLRSVLSLRETVLAVWLKQTPMNS